MLASLIRRALKPSVFVLCLLPLLLLGWQAYSGTLSANPIADITDGTGTWTLRFLAITLAVTPLRAITGWHDLARLRKMLGLYAFFYGCLHFLTYLWLDKFFDWPEMVLDVRKRPFITMGFTAFVLLVPLAITSVDKIMRWMGGKRWKRLHRLVYVSAAAGVIHYLWLVKADRQRPILYGILLAALLGYRMWDSLRRRKRTLAEGAAFLTPE